MNMILTGLEFGLGFFAAKEIWEFIMFLASKATKRA